MKFALAGNPNCGKTTLFNQLTGSTAHVGNWPGVTVDKREGTYKKFGVKAQVVDLPGIYSLSPYTPEEVVSRNYIIDENPDCVINIVDSTNLERNLYLTTQLLELDVPIVIALNMCDVLEKNGDKIDSKGLEKELNVPIVEISALKGTNIHQLMSVAMEAVNHKRVGYSVVSQNTQISKLFKKVSGYYETEGNIPFHVVKMIENDSIEIEKYANIHSETEALKQTLDLSKEEFESIVADSRYRYITEKCTKYLKKARQEALNKSDKADKVLTHRVWGIPLFLLIIFAVFHLTFSSDFLFLNGIWGVNTAANETSATFFQTIGDAIFDGEEGETLQLYAQDNGQYKLVAEYESGEFIAPIKGVDTLYTFVEGEYIEYEMPSAGVPAIGVWLQSWLGVLTDDVITENTRTAMESANVADWATSLVCDGIFTGLSSVLSFLPQVLLLFLFLSILEDSGYMARVAFIMDRAFRKFGLSGKAFMPLLMCFGCGVPGVMATKTLENEKERRMTMMVAPFMSCGAKLPIWLAFGGVLFAGQFGDIVVFSMYLIGIAVAVLGAILLKNTALKGETPPFIMELPQYHMPRIKNLAMRLWEKLKHYLYKAATIIAASIIVIWFLQNFDFDFWNGMVEIEESMLGKIGGVIKYLFYPCGFAMGDDGWKFVVSSITGLIAKEDVIATMATVSGSAGFEALVSAMSAPAAYAFMIFNLLSIPCMAMVGAVSGEMSNRKHTWQAIGFWMGTSYVVSMIAYWFGVLCEIAWWAALITAIVVIGCIITLVITLNKRKKQKITATVLGG
ncbi:MAG: ferrous iron transport protein B [Corallococcus sp.]|nr:ferrous iron transport protein B [Corallococcus sp.]